ncbi:FtsX-like permease family protein [Azospirillum sp.]|uniref:FtsX-like permease family protein n=1 Tax=Azospirillum sp. TaxID=34012 RepID=UPI003D718D94
MQTSRSTLLTRARRDARALRLRLLGIAAILGMAVGMYVGVNSAIQALHGTQDTYYRALRMADAEVRFVPDDLANVPDFSGIPGVQAWEARLTAPGQLVLPDGEIFPTAVVAQPLPAAGINEVEVNEGTPLDPAQPDAVLLDRNFASSHGVAVGDRLTLRMGNAEYALTVRGIGVSPEYLIAPASPSFFVPVKGSMAVVWAPIRMVADRLGFTLVNSAVFRLTPEAAADPQVLQALSQRAEGTLGVQEALPRSENLGHMFLDVDLGAFSVFVPAVIVVFLLTALTVGFFLIYRWVQAQRQTLGLLLALGYGRWRLLAAQLYPLALIAGAALLIAIPVSVAVLADFALTFANTVGLPSPRLAIDPTAALHGVFGLMAAVAAMAAWPLASVLRLSPAAAIRNGASSDRDGARWRTRLLHGLRHRPLVVYPVRNVIRTLHIGAMTTAAVALAIGVSISYFIAIGSFNTAIVKNFEDDRWSVSVDFLLPVWQDELGRFRDTPGVRRIEEVLQGPVRLEANGRVQPVTVTGYDPDNTLRRPTLLRGTLPGGGDNAIALEHKTARALGVEVGAPVRLVSEDRRFEVRVAAIYSGVVPNLAYAPLERVRGWLDMPEQLTGILLDLPDPSAETLRHLKRQPLVGGVTPKSLTVDQVKKTSSEEVEIIYVAAAFSIIVCVIILIASGTFTVGERREQYTTLRTIGFADRTVGTLVLIELLLLGVLGAALAPAVGYAIASYLLSTLSAAWFQVDPHVGWFDILLPTIPLLTLLPLSALPPIRSVVRVPLVTALKQRNYG